MNRFLMQSVLMTIVLTLLLGLAYPLFVTVLAQLLFRDKADGQLILSNGRVVGSRIVGQPFTGSRYFHSRPSAAGNGYDAANSSGANLSPTNKQLITRVNEAVAHETTGGDVPIDLVTSSGSGLDPHISPAAAYYQAERVARERGLSTNAVQALIHRHTEPRQFELLGEPRVNVVELNLALDQVGGAK